MKKDEAIAKVAGKYLGAIDPKIPRQPWRSPHLSSLRHSELLDY